jgi:hypothetical protein
MIANAKCACGNRIRKAIQTEVALNHTYLSALLIDSLLRIEHLPARALLRWSCLGRPCFCEARLRCILRSSECQLRPRNS